MKVLKLIEAGCSEEMQRSIVNPGIDVSQA